jgi:hypothetical protein
MADVFAGGSMHHRTISLDLAGAIIADLEVTKIGLTSHSMLSRAGTPTWVRRGDRGQRGGRARVRGASL